MKFKWIKRDQKKVNKWVRAFNQKLREDELWRGRFYVHQERIYHYHTFDDGSGGILGIAFSLNDRKTGMSKEVYFSNYNYFHLGLAMNNFIVHDVDVWHENPRPSLDTAVDYTKEY